MLFFFEEGYGTVIGVIITVWEAQGELLHEGMH